MIFRFFFFNDTATTEIYTLSLHDALPILPDVVRVDVLDGEGHRAAACDGVGRADDRDARDLRQLLQRVRGDRKSTRLNSSHANISYAVFCLKKKKSLNIYINHDTMSVGYK